MGILEVIYNAYCEGEFTVKLPEHTASDNIKITSIEKIFDMSPQQIEEFESRFLEIYDDAHKSGFYAGFRTAVRVITE